MAARLRFPGKPAAAGAAEKVSTMPPFVQLSILGVELHLQS